MICLCIKKDIDCCIISIVAYFAVRHKQCCVNTNDILKPKPQLLKQMKSTYKVTYKAITGLASSHPSNLYKRGAKTLNQLPLDIN